MWILKDKNQLKACRRKKITSPKRPFLIAIIGFFAFSAEPAYDSSVPWRQFFQEDFSKVIILTIVLFVTLYVWQLITKKPIGEKRLLICTKCHKIKHYDKNQYCECGGDRVNLYEMKWVEESKDE